MKVYESENAHFVTIATIEWLPIFLSRPYTAAVIDALRFYQEQKGLRIHAYVIMPDHLHLIVSGTDDLAKALGRFKSLTSRRIAETESKLNQLDGVTVQKMIFSE